MTIETVSLVDDDVPRVWIGCLHHYAAGFLVGHWFNAVDADQVSLADVHRGSALSYGQCEETYCLDIDNIPVQREMDVMEAAQWGRLHQEAGDQWEAVCAWVHSGCHERVGDSDLPDLDVFTDRYCGRWESFREYAEHLADDIGMMADWPTDASRYFNWDSWTRDLQFDHVVVDAGPPGYGVHVFRSC